MLIHGLGRSPWSMWPMARRLRRAGWSVALASYPSLRFPIEKSAERVAGQISARGWNKVHLVGHSLGGLIARRLMLTRPDLNVGHVVQMGSPNGGTAVADRLVEWSVARWILGPVLGQVAVFPPRPPRAAAVGSIAGTLDCAWLRRALGLNGPNDGLVTVRAAWAGAGAKVAVPVYHSFLPSSAATARLVAEFLRTGRFGRERAS